VQIPNLPTGQGVERGEEAENEDQAGEGAGERGWRGSGTGILKGWCTLHNKYKGLTLKFSGIYLFFN
jgi:hypothetical protein